MIQENKLDNIGARQELPNTAEKLDEQSGAISLASIKATVEQHWPKFIAYVAGNVKLTTDVVAFRQF